MALPISLNYKKLGESGSSVLIVHGLFGSLDNWLTFGKQLAQTHQVYLLDQRNHGNSPHTSEFSLALLAEDLANFIRVHLDSKPILIGHSLGGKAAMQLGIDNAGLVEKLAIIDIGPKAYSPHHQLILKALHSLDFSVVKTRKEAEVLFYSQIDDVSTVQFLLKNLAWGEDASLKWKFNLVSLTANILEVGKAQEGICNIETLFVRGQKSGYILGDDYLDIEQQFPFSEIITIESAGHWVHAEQPNSFFEALSPFLN